MSRAERPISQRKYDKLRDKAQKWYENCQELKIYTKELEGHLEKLIEEKENNVCNDTELSGKYDDALDSLTEYKKIVSKYESNNNHTSLNDENKQLTVQNRKLQKELLELEEERRNDFRRTFVIEKDIVLKEGKIEQQGAQIDSLKNRYADLLEEYKEMRRFDRVKRVNRDE